MAASEVLVTVAQVLGSGAALQGVSSLFRRRSELRKLDRESDKVFVDTADRMITLVRSELEQTRMELDRCRAERDDLRDKMRVLADDLAETRTDLVIARADVKRMRGETGG